MYLDSKKKQEIFKKFGKGESDTGTAEGQIALFTHRITHLTAHLKLNKKDYNTQRSLVLLVGKRRDQLDYLKVKDIENSASKFIWSNIFKNSKIPFSLLIRPTYKNLALLDKTFFLFFNHSSSNLDIYTRCDFFLSNSL